MHDKAGKGEELRLDGVGGINHQSKVEVTLP